MPRYKLRRKYWDGTFMHERGTVLQLPEGTAPSTAVNLDESDEPEAPAKAPAADPDTLAAMTPKAPGEKAKSK